jgi:beta-aspartyl-peptidase (threonine type)
LTVRAAALALALLAVACGERDPGWSLAIHGGARMLAPEDYTESERAAIHRELVAALLAGARVLEGGGASVDAVQAAVMAMEDSPWFNAGRGAVFTHAGTHELDASIMDGGTGKAGAVAGVRRIRNPVLLARDVMDHTPHVLLAGEGAEAFAVERGMALVDPAYFYTERRWRELQQALEREKKSPSASARAAYFGTVGAVALDREGRLAAATSTGGMTNKRPGRVGDSPLIGAGTFADGRCAVSATGHGEYFIRAAVAYDICARSRYQAIEAGRAAREVIHGTLKAAGGEGGVIVMDARGRASFEFNTNAMSRGALEQGGEPRVAIGDAEALAGVAGR